MHKTTEGSSCINCDKAAVVRGVCTAHYKRARRDGLLAELPRANRARGTGAVSHGYISLHVDGRRVPEHVFVAEQALGKRLPKNAEVHHWNEDRADNRGENLVVCPNHAYHMLLHVRARAFDACGNASWRHCIHCKQYDAPENLSPNGYTSFCHAKCRAAHRREKRAH